MRKIPKFPNAEAEVVWLAQQFRPTMMHEYLLWMDVWRADPENGRGRLPSAWESVRGDGIFWEVLDPRRGNVQCYVVKGVSKLLRRRLEEAWGVRQ